MFFKICNYRYQFLQFKGSIQVHVLNAYLMLLKVNIKSFADWMASLKSSTLLIIRETQIKTQWGITLYQSGWPSWKKNTHKHKCWRGCEEKGTHLHCWWECKLVQPLWQTVWRFLKKPKIESPYDPAIPHLGIYPEKMKTLIWKDTCTRVFIAALFTIAKNGSNTSAHSQISR